MSLLHLGRAVIINDQRAVNTMNGVESVKIIDTKLVNLNESTVKGL